MPNNQQEAIVTALLDALTLEWLDNGNIMADAVRDECITALANALGKTFQDIQTMVDSRILDKQ